MSENVRISFIPKEPLARGKGLRRERPVVGVSFMLAMIVVSSTMLGALGLLVWKHTIHSHRLELLVDLSTFNTQISQGKDKELIEDVRSFQGQVAETKGVLDRHLAQTILFDFIERVTLSSILYTEFGVVVEDGIAKASMQGIAPSYESLAYFSAKLKEESGVIIKYSLTELSLDLDVGTIAFVMTAELDPTSIEYARLFDTVEDVIELDPIVPIEVMEAEVETATGTDGIVDVVINEGEIQP